MAYLGLFSSVFNWVFEKILSPIVLFLSDILSAIFEWVFNVILQPLLVLVFKLVLPWAIELLKDLFSGLLYSALSWICKILDYFQEIFAILAGMQPVRVLEGGTSYRETSLLGAIFSLSEVNKMFLYLLVLGFGLAFTCAIIAVIKSTIDLDFENKRPVGAVLRSLFKAFIHFLTLNLVVVFILMLSGRMLNTVSLATGTNDVSLGRIVFCSTTLNAHRNDAQNISKFPVEKNIMTDTDRKYFYYKSVQGARDYANSDDVTKYFYLHKLDFVTGIVVCVFLAIVMFGSCITFIQRIFDIIILYLVSPLFVATMPLDEGEKYKKWKDLFIGKVFTGFGAVLAMNLFLILVPIIMGNQISWGQESAEGTYIFKLLFLCGGAYALNKVGPMLTTLINWQAGQSESENAAYASSLIGGAVASGAVSLAKDGAMKLGHAFASPFRSAYDYAFGEGDRSDIADQKWESMQENGLSDEDRAKLEAEKEKEKEKDGNNKADIEDKKPDGEGNDDKDKEKEKGLEKVEPSKFDKFMKSCHKIFPAKEDKNGNYSVGLLGFKINYNKDGKKTGIKTPVATWGRTADGSMKWDSWKIPGVCTARRGQNTGKFKLSSIPAFGFRRFEDKDGNNRISSVLGFNQELGKDGQMHMTKGWLGYSASAASDGTYHTDSIMGVKFGRSYNKDSGQYETSGVRVGNFIFGGADPTAGSAHLEEEQPEQKQKKK